MTYVFLSLKDFVEGVKKDADHLRSLPYSTEKERQANIGKAHVLELHVIHVLNNSNLIDLKADEDSLPHFMQAERPSEEAMRLLDEDKDAVL